MLIPDAIKRALIRLDRLPERLERHGIVTYGDRARLRRNLYHSEIRFSQEGQDTIADLLVENRPLMISRLGSVELSCLRFYLERRQGTKRPYRSRTCALMANPAGFFPIRDDLLDSFAELYLQELRKSDLMGVWFNLYEDVVCNRYCPDAALVDFDCLEPFRFEKPWSRHLAGRTVLVVHPFAASIRKQYQDKRHLLFTDQAVLPDFELKTLRSVQSIDGVRGRFVTWFDAYRHMCDEVAKISFDICIIGAGAYGLPLAAFVKDLGRQAIHLGGVTQILFGIKGKRWETQYADSTAKLFNEHWTRPLPEETPENMNQIEKGCYW